MLHYGILGLTPGLAPSLTCSKSERIRELSLDWDLPTSAVGRHSKLLGARVLRSIQVS